MKWLRLLIWPATLALAVLPGLRHVDDGSPAMHFAHWGDALFLAALVFGAGVDLGMHLARREVRAVFEVRS